MSLFQIIRYFIKAKINITKKNYNNALYNYCKCVRNDSKPTNKIINYDNEIEKITDKILDKKNIKLKRADIKEYPKTNIMILNTEIYDNGGHTMLAMNYIDTFKDEFDIYFYLTDIFNIKETSVVKSKIIKNDVKDYHMSNRELMEDKIIELYNYIIDNKITTINVNMHMYDVVGAAVLYLVRKNTNINIIFWNHADHFYCIGTKYPHWISTRTNNGQAYIPYQKKYKNLISLPFLIKEKPLNHIIDVRKELNIPQDAIVTLTGCALYKIDKHYFKLIKKVLNYNKNIYHILVTSTQDPKANKLIKKYKLNSKRFIIQNCTPYFDDYILASNFYIDSFPQGSALTLVDCARLSRPAVVKINKKHPEKSFEEYLYEDYEFKSETVDGMYEKIKKLIEDKDLYKITQTKVHNYYKKIYSYEIAKEKNRQYIK